ncbi:acetate--CoA ligase family protein [Planctomycetota bacterium]
MNSGRKEIITQALSAGRTTLTEHESKKVLAEYGIAVTRETLVMDPGEAEKAAADIGYPVVVKVCSDQASHKSEGGLVKVGIRDATELSAVAAELGLRAAELGGGLLIQEMVAGKRELVMGLMRDPLFGPCVMFGLGGIFTEALKDVAFRPAPLSKEDALEMIGETKAAALLGPVRGMEPADMDMLADNLMQLGQLAIDNPFIHEVDINPLIVRDGKPIAVDGLIVLSEEEAVADIVRAKAPLDPLYAPRSVAIIGASAKTGKAGNDVIKNILANDYEGEIYPVNPKGGQIEGLKVYSSIADLPEGIDLAIIILPAKVTPGVIRECGAQGIKTAVLAAGGFAEYDAGGAALQEETKKALEDTGIRALGPNTSGHITTPANFTSSFFPLGKIPKGRISYITQTGNFATHTMRYVMSVEHYGISRVTGMGNKLDVDEADALEWYADDPETEAIFVYLEDFKRPRKFLEIAREVTRTKPIVFLKGGATEEGAQAAVAHTAAMASDDRIIDGALKQAGIVRIHKYTHLVKAAKAMACMPLPKGNRISFMAPSGAMLVTMTDYCRKFTGLQIAEIEDATRQRLQDMSPPFVTMRNPVDIWPAVTIDGLEKAYTRGSEAVFEDPNVDAVVMILMLMDEVELDSLDFVVNLAKRYPDKPLLVTFSGQKSHMEAAKEFLEPRGVPTFALIEDAFAVLDVLCKCGKAKARA